MRSLSSYNLNYKTSDTTTCDSVLEKRKSNIPDVGPFSFFIPIPEVRPVGVEPTTGWFEASYSIH